VQWIIADIKTGQSLELNNDNNTAHEFKLDKFPIESDNSCTETTFRINKTRLKSTLLTTPNWTDFPIQSGNSCNRLLATSRLDKVYEQNKPANKILLTISN
jgi:hypothetical protein